MSRRTDTLVRYALITAGVVAVLLMYVVADTESLSRNQRFTFLVALGSLVLIGWPGLAIAEPYADRRPLRMKWGRPPQPDAKERHAPEPIRPAAAPVAIAIDRRNSLLAIGGSIVIGSGMGILGHARAGTGGSNLGGLLSYVGVAWAILITLRAAARIITGHRAVTLDDERITLGFGSGLRPTADHCSHDGVVRGNGSWTGIETRRRERLRPPL